MSGAEKNDSSTAVAVSAGTGSGEVSQHTPGPWMVHRYPVRVGPYNQGIDVGTRGMAVCTVIGAFEQPKPGAEAEANARLIAAAPDMKEALADSLSVLEEITARAPDQQTWHRIGCALNSARAALSKAGA